VERTLLFTYQPKQQLSSAYKIVDCSVIYPSHYIEVDNKNSTFQAVPYCAPLGTHTSVIRLNYAVRNCRNRSRVLPVAVRCFASFVVVIQSIMGAISKSNDQLKDRQTQVTGVSRISD